MATAATEEFEFIESGNSPPSTRLIDEYDRLKAEGGEVRVRHDLLADAVIPETACVNVQDMPGKRRDRQQAVINGFYCCLAGGGTEDLFKAVRELAVVMLRRVTKDFGDAGACGNHDDLAQDICLKVLEKFDDFAGDGKQFLHFVTKIIRGKRIDATRQRLDDMGAIRRDAEGKIINANAPVFVPFHVDRTNEDGNVEEIENPALYEESYRRTMIEIPASIQGEDLQICRWMLAGMTYAQIGKETGLTARAVETRLYRIRERESAVLARQREQRAKNDVAEKERQTYRQRMAKEYIDRLNARLNPPEWDGPEWSAPEREPEREPANIELGSTTVPFVEEDD